MAPIQTTPQEAINHIKTWVSNNEFEKAKQGIDEILEFDPVNSEAKKLREELEVKIKFEAEKLAAAETQKSAAVKTAQPPAPATVVQPTTPNKMAQITEPAPTATAVLPERTHRKISLAGIISAIIVLTISGGIGFYASRYLAAPQTAQTLEETQNSSANSGVEPQTGALKGLTITGNETETAPKSTVESAPESTVESAVQSAPQNPLMFLLNAFGFGSTNIEPAAKLPPTEMSITKLPKKESPTETSPQRIKVKRR